MPKRRMVSLDEQQIQALREARDHHPAPYIRERAGAILKVVSGQSIRQVALQGLYKRRDPETVGRWVSRYETKGIAGLMVNPGRGRKPVFSPSDRGRSQRSRA